MCLKKGKQLDQIQILRKELAFQRSASIAAIQDTLLNIVLTWEFIVTPRLYRNLSISLTSQMKLKLDLVKLEDLEGLSRKERFVV